MISRPPFYPLVLDFLSVYPRVLHPETSRFPSGPWRPRYEFLNLCQAERAFCPTGLDNPPVVYRSASLSIHFCFSCSSITSMVSVSRALICPEQICSTLAAAEFGLFYVLQAQVQIPSLVRPSIILLVTINCIEHIGAS
jgi:hypothetical protein